MPGERVRDLKQVGDTSLYVAGFFAESLTRSLVDVDYYVGHRPERVRAARAVARRRAASRSTEVYEELAEKFPQLRRRARRGPQAHAIAELNATPDIGKLYEIWLRTREEWIEKKLRALGVLVDVDRKVIQ